jgi:8-oxo-dGTP pyrophosphatase MutT (NUDIX family)
MKLREAIRAIVITSKAEVLLMRIRLPGHDDCFWIAPGGGIECGESVESCLKRELEEELGLRQFDLGPLVWLRQHTFDWDGQRTRQSERYYIVAVDRFEPNMTDPSEARTLQQFRWWHASELENAEERLTPLALAKVVSEYLTHGPPKLPLDVEVLED